MKRVTASQAKQNFGELLEGCASQPIAIERHNRVRAVVCSLEAFESLGGHASALAKRHMVRAEQDLKEKQRLIDHQRAAIRLLVAPPKQARAWVDTARQEVSRWRRANLCSTDYCDRWEALLSQSVPALAQALGSEDLDWGPALRRNSPWSVVPI